MPFLLLLLSTASVSVDATEKGKKGSISSLLSSLANSDEGTERVNDDAVAVLKDGGKTERGRVSRICGAHASVLLGIPQKRRTQQPILLVAVLGTRENNLMVLRNDRVIFGCTWCFVPRALREVPCLQTRDQN